ncbi:hypothetical protein CCP3SC1AL1_230018 [Gammaproteobacteria bacterium]
MVFRFICHQKVGQGEKTDLSHQWYFDSGCWHVVYDGFVGNCPFVSRAV